MIAELIILTAVVAGILIGVGLAPSIYRSSSSLKIVAQAWDLTGKPRRIDVSIHVSGAYEEDPRDIAQRVARAVEDLSLGRDPIAAPPGPPIR